MIDLEVPKKLSVVAKMARDIAEGAQAARARVARGGAGQLNAAADNVDNATGNDEGGW